MTIPSSPNCYADQPDSTPKSLELAHLQALKQKLSGSRSAGIIPNQEFLRQLLLNQIMYLPFTVDYLGGLGHHAHLLLYGTAPPPPITLTPNWDALQSLRTKQLSKQLKAAPQGLLPLATKAFAAAVKDPTAFTPTQWAIKTLSVNFSHAIASHTHRCLEAQYASLHSSMPDSTLQCRYVPFRSIPDAPHTPYLHFPGLSFAVA